MNSYVSAVYQFVWGTKNRRPVLRADGRDALYAYIAGILKNKRCELYAIRAVEDHLHIVLDLHKSLSVAGLVKDIKLATHEFIDLQKLFPAFDYWQEGYAALSYHSSAIPELKAYVEGQDAHHASELNYRLELMRLLEEHAVGFDEKYLD